MGDKPDASDDMDIEASANSFERLELDFQEVLAELVGDKNLDRYRVEYEKIHRALKKSHESEKRLIKKVRDLNAEIVRNAQKVQSAIRLSSEDSNTISQLRKQIEHNWKIVEASNEKEVRSRELVANLKKEIEGLSRLVEQGAGLSVGQETLIKELRDAKAQLEQERNDIFGTVTALRQEQTELLDKNRELEKEKSQLEADVLSQKELITSVHATTDREKARRQVKENALLKAMEESDILKKDILDREAKVREGEEEVLKLRKEGDSLDEKIQNLKKLMDGREKALAEEKKKFTAITAKNDKLVSEIDEKMSELSRTQEEKAAIQKRLEDMDARANALEAEKKSLQAALAKSEDDRTRLRQDYDNEKRNLLEAQSKAEKDRKAYDKISKDKAALEGKNQQAHRTLEHKDDLLQQRATLKNKLEQEIANHKTHAQEQRKNIYQLEKEIERYASESSNATAKFMKASDDVKMADLTILDLQKKIAEADAKLKQQQNMYDTARTERNHYSKVLLEAQDEISEMKQKCAIDTNNIKQYKEEIEYHRNDLIKATYERKKVEKERDATLQQKATIESQLKESQQLIETQEKEIIALNKKVQESEVERMRQRKEYEAVINERDMLGTQLIRRNDELALLYEKIKIFQSNLSKGEAQYHERVDELRSFRLKVQDLQRQLKNARGTAQQVVTLRQDLNQAQAELIQEKLRVKALSEELENPLNVHRWRKLEGSDPTTFDMLQKIQTLQKRLIAKTEEAAEKDMLIKDFEERYGALKVRLARQPGPEVAQQELQYTANLREKTKQMKAMAAELNTYQAQVDEYKFQIERLTGENVELKKNYLDQKRRELIQRQRAASKDGSSTSTSRAPTDEHGNTIRFHGGGFNSSH